ncbi:MAG: adenylate/guanylate cyclase domain-containing protein [Candidatus Gagatemarchaeaceae archaeon]
MVIRVGIHVGDIVHSGGDVLGDAVNVAARVQPLAEPGGVCLTRQVVDQVERKVPFRISMMGSRELKNIGYPVEVYKVMMASESSTGDSQKLDPHRIAILPFTNMSADPNDRYFADGMTEELISTVSRIGELSVISRTSVMRYKDTTVSIGEIGRELSAGTVLEGSVRKAGNRVRITTQLIDAGNDKHLWAQSYDRDLTDVFEIQGDIAGQVAEALKVQLVSKEKESIERRRTVNPDAYTLYLKGRFYWNERTEEGVKTALKYFGDAVKIDPNFAMAYSGLADSYSVLGDYGFMPQADALVLSKHHALQALELDDSLAEAHASLGLALSQEWDFKGSEARYKRALELSPNAAYAAHWYSLLLFSMGRYEEGYLLERRAFDLDPYSRPMGGTVALYLALRGERREAIDVLDKLIRTNPGYALSYYWRSYVYVCELNYPQAIEDAKKAVELEENGATKLNLAWTLAASGDMDAASKMLDELLAGPEGGNVRPADVGSVMLLAGRLDEGFAWMKKGIGQRDPKLFGFGIAPQERVFLKDPRWKEIADAVRALGAATWPVPSEAA